MPLHIYIYYVYDVRFARIAHTNSRLFERVDTEEYFIHDECCASKIQNRLKEKANNNNEINEVDGIRGTLNTTTTRTDVRASRTKTERKKESETWVP